MIEPIGIATIVIGLICLRLGLSATVVTFMVSALFGSAAALLIGSANIQPGHLFLGFLLIAAIARSPQAEEILKQFRPDRAGFWLACLTLYGLATAYFAPRLLAGVTEIVPLGVTDFDSTGSTVPLTTVSSNLTQSVYLLADMICFGLIAGIAATPAGFAACMTGLLAYAAGNAFFAAADVVTYYTGTDGLLGFMRNAQYVLHTDVEVFGLKRIVGSFTEASSMARSTLGVFGVTGTLWLCCYRPRLTGTMALTSFALLILSTSSTGLAGAPLMAVVLYLTAILRSGVGTSERNSAATVLFLPPAVVAAAIVLMLYPNLFHAAYGYLDFILLQKSQSDSGIERGGWNDAAIENFVDTWGLGVGLGTARTSGLIFAIIGNVGVIGAVFYCIFAAFVLVRAVPAGRGRYADCRLAACNGFIGLMIGDLLVSPAVDQGLLFYALGAIACAFPEHSPEYRSGSQTMGATA